MRILVCAALLAMNSLSFAAEKTSKVFPLAYDQHDFDNGLRLVTIPTDNPNVVALYIVVATGSRNEVEPGKTGFAHLFEHLMFRGTKNISPEQYEAIMRQAGAATNAYTSDDLTAYHATFSKEDLDEMLRIEADRFQHLEFGEHVIRTESLAVLGEYNKNSAEPAEKLEEAIRETAFDKHTYKHTTMGFLKDVQDMPNQYEYSKLFFDRYYRPEYTTVLLVGDVTPERARQLVGKYWGAWKRGSYAPPIPTEPPQKGARTAKVDWPTETLPWVAVNYKSAAYSDTEKDSAALDLIAQIGFGENSDLYRRLVIEQQSVDQLAAENPDHVDPYLFSVISRVKKPSEVPAVQESILSTLNGFKDTLVPAEKLETVKRRLRYEFAMSLNNSQSIADTVARFIALRRTPETINRRYDLYQQITPEDLRNVARKYFVESGRTIVTLTGPQKPGPQK